MVRNQGENHFAVLYAKINEVTLKDVDQIAYELISDHLESIKDETKKNTAYDNVPIIE